MAFYWGLVIGLFCGIGITLCCVGSIYWRSDIND